MGANHARTIHRSEEFQLSFIVDEDLERAKGLAQQFGATAVSSIDEIKDVQAAVVATSTNSHFGIVENLLEMKIPVLCEKPLTPSLDTTRALIEISEKNATPIQCGFVERFNPAFLTAKKMIDQPVIHAQSVRHSPPAVRIASGVAEDLLIHDLDLALSLTNSPVKSVAGSVYKSAFTGEDEISDCIINLEDNAVFTLSASRMSQRKIRDWRICTEKDLIEVDLLRQTVTIYENINQEFLNQGNATYRARTMVDYPFIERSGEPLAMQLQHFAKLLNGEVHERTERQSILASHAVLSDFLENSRTE
jgi:predicted dehydrogenase